MSKHIATFPDKSPNMSIEISGGGVELHCDGPTMVLDPVQARTLATLLMHASSEAEMMHMRAKMNEEHEARLLSGTELEARRRAGG